MLKNDKDFKVLLLVILMGVSVLLSAVVNGCNIKQPHPVWDSIYMS